MKLDDFLIDAGESCRKALELQSRNEKGIVFARGSDWIGCLTDGDVRRGILTQDLDLDKTVGEVCNRDAVLCASRAEAFDTLKSNRALRAVPVVDGMNVVDLVTLDDLETIPLVSPQFNGNEVKYVLDCLESGWISSQGKYVSRFEIQFEEFLTRHCVSASSGTSALHLALLSLGVSPGDKVVVPDFTFAATINSVLMSGARPVICDVDQDTGNMCAETLQKILLNSQIKAVIFVSIYGNSQGTEEIAELCRNNGVFLVEDAAEALGSRLPSGIVGQFGDAATFSFFGNKTITTGEGGMVAFKSKETAELAAQLRDHGMSRQQRYWHELVGYNYRITNLQAAVGVAQFEQIDKILDDKLRIAQIYDQLLPDNLEKPEYYSDMRHSYWLYTIRLNSQEKRDRLSSELKRFQVETRPAFHNLSSMPIYEEFRHEPCERASDWSKRGLCLPTGRGLKHEVIEQISSCIEEVL